MANSPALAPFEIADARPGDGEPICRVMAETWLDTYPNEHYGITADMIRERHYEPDGSLNQGNVATTESHIVSPIDGLLIFTARSEGEVVGVSSAKVTEAGKRKVNTLFVLPKAQSRGIGPKLLDRVLESLGQDEDTYLKVVAYNRRAMSLYARYGFVVVGPVAAADQMRFNNGIILPELEMARRD